MDSRSNTTDYQLPPCVLEVQEAANELYKIIYSIHEDQGKNIPFPSLDINPSSSDDIHKIISEAILWAKNIREIYGNPSDYLNKNTLVSMFIRPEDNTYYLEWIGKNPFGVNWDKEKGIPRNFQVNLNKIFRCSGVWHAANVLGDLPVQFLYSGAEFFSGNTTNIIYSLHNILLDNEIELVPDNWPEIRETLQAVHMTILRKSLCFINWVRGRINELKTALYPRIEYIAEAKYNNIEVIITHAGKHHKKEITNNQGFFLKELSNKGHAEIDRSTKKDLVDNRIPELNFLIKACKTKHKSKSDNTLTTYEIPDEMIKRLDFSQLK